MFAKCNKMLAVIMSAALSITAFSSDFASAKVWAADEEITEAVQSEETSSETEGESEESESSAEDQNTEETYDVEEAAVEDSEYTEEIEYSEETTEEVIETTENTEYTENAENSEELGAEELENSELGAEELEAEELETEELSEEELAAKALKEAEEKAQVNDSEEYPAQSFSGSVADMNVYVDAPEGTFPKGTSMNLSAISDSQAVSAANDAIDGEVKEAKGVDISFNNADGNEIEPNGAVNVSISLANALEGDSFSVVHLDDNGNSEMVAGASNSGASFSADAFSIYIVASSGDSSSDTKDIKAYATYEFIYNGEVFNSQVVKKGDLLQSPGNPVDDDCTVFLGWFLLLNGEKLPVFFDENIKPVDMTTICGVNAGETYRLYAATSKIDYELKDNGAFYFATNTVYDDETLKIEISSKGFVNGEYSIDLFINGEKIVVAPECCEYIRNHVELICQGAEITCAFIEYLVDISEKRTVEIEDTSITYHSNDGTNRSFTLGVAKDPTGLRLRAARALAKAPSDLKVNEAVSALDIANDDFNWERPGYRFVGWSKMDGDNANNLFATAGQVIAADNIEANSANHLYAMWVADPVEETPAEEEKPAEETPAEEEKPSEEKPAEEEKPSEETPAEEEKPSEEKPAEEEKPSEETPAEEEKPSEEDPSEDPAEEKPSEDPAPATPAAPSKQETSSTSEPTSNEVAQAPAEIPAETPSEDPIAEIPVAVEEETAVLGEKRINDLPEVLGARRASTEDDTNVAGRVIAILIAVLAAAGLLVIGKKKEEE